jgi:hypothetical protein
MNERPIERLNFFNGQRLQAADLKLEQDYHMRVRRWLNRSLYTAGIASGLTVQKVPKRPKVRVSPGLALDSLGREIILLDEREEIVPGAQDETNKPISLYLTIRYSEEALAHEDACCPPKNGSADKAASGGPSRVLAEPVLEWSRDLPHESSGKVLLAYVGLGKNCQDVNLLDTGVRRYVGAASAAKVRQYALEGEKEVAFIPKEAFAIPGEKEPAVHNDVTVVGRIPFHIRGRQPSSVTLYLRGEQFSPLHYTELGLHSHGATLSGQLSDHTIDQQSMAHTHLPGTLITKIEKEDDDNPEVISDGVSTFRPHQHYLFGRVRRPWGVLAAHLPGEQTAFQLAWTSSAKELVDNDVGLEVRWGRHRHELDGKTAGPGDFTPITLKHDAVSASGSTIASGVDAAARSGPPLQFVDNLQIWIGNPNSLSLQTDRILQQIAMANPAGWSRTTKIGEGSGTDVFHSTGTGPIRLDFLPTLAFSEGEYWIELRVGSTFDGQGRPVANGGRIHYNLYVE